MGCICNEWTSQEQDKIKELEGSFDTLEIEQILTYSTIRAAAIRKMQCLKKTLKWLPTDDPCRYYMSLGPSKEVKRGFSFRTRKTKTATNNDNTSILAEPLRKYEGGYYTNGETFEDFKSVYIMKNDTIYRELVFIDDKGQRLQFVGMAYQITDIAGSF